MKKDSGKGEGMMEWSAGIEVDRLGWQQRVEALCATWHEIDRRQVTTT